MIPLASLENPAAFAQRHIGPNLQDQAHMLQALGLHSLDELVERVTPTTIRRQDTPQLPVPASEENALNELRQIAQKNQVFKSFIGQGYYGTHTPAVILRNVLENPAWYTAYTPYQAEISQGRLEALFNFQTMIVELTGMDIANASMLDEATAAAEALALALRQYQGSARVFYVDQDVLPQTLQVLQTRARTLGVELRSGFGEAALTGKSFGVLLQYPGASGAVRDFDAWVAHYRNHNPQGIVVAACDLLALTLLTPPGEWGADIAVGNSQRFGMPMGAGGPHAAFMASKNALKRYLPGRLVGLSKDANGQPALRLALQTREQHIRREKANSNICTAQVLPAMVASMYAVYHGPQGLRSIAQRVASYTALLASGLEQLGYPCTHKHFFDTLTLVLPDAKAQVLQQKAWDKRMNMRHTETGVAIALDETTTLGDVQALWGIFAGDGQALPGLPDVIGDGLPPPLRRQSAFLSHPVFQRYRSETAMLRYLRGLSDKDLALDRSMIPLGSCTMKLNASSEMMPITWPEFAHIHPFAPDWQQAGYAELDTQLRQWLSAATGYADVSLEPNAGSQGEYAGLLAIRAYHAAQGQAKRTVCLIPASAHGTNPASARMAGLQVVVVACDDQGNIDMQDLKAKCETHSANLACIMITYPSTHGVFEAEVKTLCDWVHKHGGRVYVDGANMNALLGLAAPGQFGGDVSHLNLHKTFCIPHGGGGPGVGPVCVVEDLKPYLPRRGTIGAISAAPLGNAAVLPISWMYLRMMGSSGLYQATASAILSANYIRHALAQDYPTLYSNDQGWVAHECILDLRPLKERSGISAEDVAKRLIDYGFHAPTLSFPVPGTLMVEPTESEPLAEIERFIIAMRSIRAEISHIENGKWDKADNPLKNAPHTAQTITQADWPHPYSREEAVFPQGSKRPKYWAPVVRIDNVYGDRHLVCSCPPVSDYT